MAVAEVLSIICLLFTIILSSVVIKDCWEYLDIIDSLRLVIFLSLLLISLSALVIRNTIIS